MTPARTALLLLLLVPGPASAIAGPREAREFWRAAQDLPPSDARARLAALRAARGATTPGDPCYARAAAAEGRVLRAGGWTAAAAAAEALAAESGPRHDARRLAHALAAARIWRDDGEDVRETVEAVRRDAGSAAPSAAAAALDLLGELAADAGDAPGLARLVAQAASEAPHRPDVALRLLDRLGLLALASGDLHAAREAAAAERRLLEAAERRGGPEAQAASRAWLRLLLPARLGD
jgi:hypothetical protein